MISRENLINIKEKFTSFCDSNTCKTCKYNIYNSMRECRSAYMINESCTNNKEEIISSFKNLTLKDRMQVYKIISKML